MSTFGAPVFYYGPGFGNLQGWQWPQDIPGTPPATNAKEEKITEGVKTNRQSLISPSSPMYMPALDFDGYGGGTAAFSSDQTDANTASRITQRRLAGSYYNYRRMRADGIVAIGREIADALISVSNWSYEGKDEDVDEEWVELVREMWERSGALSQSHQGMSLREFILGESCRAKDYGNHTLEIVYGYNPDGETIVTEFLPLLPENTRPLLYANTRQFAGVRNWSINGVTIDLDPQYCVRFVYDSEGGDLFGRSRFENCKDWIQLKWDVRDKIRTDMNTTIGNIMAVGYPVDADSYKQAVNKGVAETIAVSLSRGWTVAVPGFSMADQMALARNNIDASKLKAYPIDRINTGASNSFDGFKAAVDMFDEQILFGLLALPRSVKEAQHGSRADAEEHTDSMATMAWRWITYVSGIAQQVTDEVLEQNFGREARGSVLVKPVPIDDQSVAIVNSIMTTLLSGNPDLAMKIIDMRANLEKLGIKALPDFDQAKVSLQLAVAKGAAGEAISDGERLRNAGYDDAAVTKIQKEKREQDAIPSGDPDELGKRGAA